MKPWTPRQRTLALALLTISLLLSILAAPALPYRALLLVWLANNIAFVAVMSKLAYDRLYFRRQPKGGER